MVPAEGRPTFDVVILAAGYGTRLASLNIDQPKPLVPVAGRPVLDYVMDHLEQEALVSSVRRVVVATNDKFYEAFESWRRQRSWPWPFIVHNDRTRCNEERKGSIGDLAEVCQVYGLGRGCSPVLVIGGDNLFDCDLVPFYQEASARHHPTIGVFQLDDRSKAREFGVVRCDGEGRIIAFLEKPQDPPTTLAAMCLYYFPQDLVQYLEAYRSCAANLDKAGDFIAWLSQQGPVYAHVFRGHWFDIGSPQTYQQAQRYFEQRRMQTFKERTPQ